MSSTKDTDKMFLTFLIKALLSLMIFNSCGSTVATDSSAIVKKDAPIFYSISWKRGWVVEKSSPFEVEDYDEYFTVLLLSEGRCIVEIERIHDFVPTYSYNECKYFSSRDILMVCTSSDTF